MTGLQVALSQNENFILYTNTQKNIQYHFLYHGVQSIEDLVLK